MAKSAEKLEKLWSVAEIAEAWVLSPNTIYEYIANGELPYINMGNGRAKVRVRQTAVDAFLARRASDKNIGGKPQLRSVGDVA
jgi:excisionase family DNA binding protein